ncbi:hypothetical protein [Sphingobium phenoxybenzoativorans]|uniref:hypothetical protein n=1 Tax=Sphingobium phenoxybenzoativorans TaxID=1592790 RepID=UPI000871C6FB|nr:hypothetical protein [Sphingobium phenoxybenzoativorans]
MHDNGKFPEILTPSQIRFEIDFAFGQLSRGALRDWAGKNELKSAAARRYIVDQIAVRFERLQVRGPGLAQNPLYFTTKLSE